MKKIIVIFIVLLIVIMVRLFMTVNANYGYERRLVKEVVANYDDVNVNYVNKYNSYLIFTTDSYLIVLDKDYEEIFKEDINKLYDMDGDFDILYKQNKVMYEKSKIDDRVLTYTYYDIYTGEELSEVVLGGQGYGFEVN